MTRLISGPEALIELLLAQHRMDRQQGLRTGGFVSGYRGSPLGGYDFALWRHRDRLRRAHIVFEPGLNEELAATMVWGSQHLGLYGGGDFDGVFGLWYGKNPGLDRSGDSIKHANFNGCMPAGGVLAVSGDDPGAQSSSIPNQCDQAFISSAVPVLAPSGLADFLRLGLLGYGLSRFAGLWVGMKMPADLVEGAAMFDPDSIRVVPLPPEDFPLPAKGLAPRWPNTRWELDENLFQVKLPAARAFAQHNGLDETLVAPPAGRGRLGLISTGKAHRDLAEALTLLGLDDGMMGDLGIGWRRVAMVWPLEPEGNGAFAHQFDEILMVEERRAVVEPQLKDLAYHWPADRRPRIIGKRDERGETLIPVIGETSPGQIARLLAERILAWPELESGFADRLKERLARLEPPPLPEGAAGPPRLPHFCAGCPHGRSTRIADGGLAAAGIGCHSLAMWMPGDSTRPVAQMGGEGTTWIGSEPFLHADHFFQNLGDGTYVHSGSLAIRAAVAANSHITFKILCNQAVAMTGGQPVEGQPTPETIAWQVHGEGVAPIFLLRGRQERGGGHYRGLPPGAVVEDRDNLFDVMERCRQAPGVSAIIYDQICATEKRRLRKSGAGFADEPAVVINERVCEGCGDCSAKSRCVAIGARTTEFGIKRWIDDSVCNTDLSCLDGFCPSFVTLQGARPRRHLPDLSVADIASGLPEPEPAGCADGYHMLISGVGGTGLVTIGALLSAAIRHQGLVCSVLDNTGIARKGGEVLTHVRVSADPERLAPRIPEGGADLLLGGDLATAAHANSLSRLKRPGGRIVALDEPVPAIDQALDPETPPDAGLLTERLRQTVGGGNVHLVAARRIARQALGDTIFGNQVLLGFALQKGLLPVGAKALEQAIRDAGVKVPENLAALSLGRLAVADGDALERRIGGDPATDTPKPREPVELRDHFAAELVRYQDQHYAQRYEALVQKAIAREGEVMGEPGALAEAVARNAFRLMAYKDEYEVARLMSDGEFLAALKDRHDGDFTIQYHLAPPFLQRFGTVDGRGEKRVFGPWMGRVFRVLARFKGLRGSMLDPFGYQAERRMERRLARDYEARMERALVLLTPDNHASIVELARLPAAIRGFGPVKAKAVADVAGRTRVIETELFGGAVEAS